MPVQPKTLKRAIELKMAELGINKAKLAEQLGIGAPKLSQILSGKRQLDVHFSKVVHRNLHIDAAFLLTYA